MTYIGTIHGKNTFENDKSQKVLLKKTFVNMKRKFCK